ncbi:MAG: cobalt ECF transporter T component CbiQ [Oscillatoriales cyanobacterium SM2_2_1]|nr:cobalt ECF transporter T component CbiQ [Oscillatoriales cyanobacterium SM2_2_1]
MDGVQWRRGITESIGFGGYCRGTSPIHYWHPTCKLLGIGTLLLASAAMTQWTWTLCFSGIALGIARLSQLPGHYFRRRARYPGLFIFAIVITAPLSMGRHTLFQWQQIHLYAEGLSWAILIASRFGTLLLFTLTLLGTTPLPHLLAALRSLGLSPWLLDLFLLTIRYLQDLNDCVQAMKTAMRLRGGGRQIHLRHWAALAGSLLIRSYEKSERIDRAMRLRGYQAGLLYETLPPPQTADYWGAGATALLGLGLLLAAKVYPILGF